MGYWTNPFYFSLTSGLHFKPKGHFNCIEVSIVVAF